MVLLLPKLGDSRKKVPTLYPSYVTMIYTSKTDYQLKPKNSQPLMSKTVQLVSILGDGPTYVPTYATSYKHKYYLMDS